MTAPAPNAYGCYDPQCLDSTWDHPCPVPPEGAVPASQAHPPRRLDMLDVLAQFNDARAEAQHLRDQVEILERNARHHRILAARQMREEFRRYAAMCQRDNIGPWGMSAHLFRLARMLDTWLGEPMAGDPTT